MRTLRRQLGSLLAVAVGCMVGSACVRQSLAIGPYPDAGHRRLSLPSPQLGLVAEDSTGASSDAASAGIEAVGRGEFARIEDMLAARVPGLEVVRRADGLYSLRVRGVASVMGGEPLLVIDDVRIDGDATGMLGALSPRDVQRIEVLKDAAATAIYGPRGANGVVVISTRRGR